MLTIIVALSSSEPMYAREGQIALTFDDLPALTLLDSQAYVSWLNRALLHGLKRHHMPAIGFVIGQKLDGSNRERQVRVLKMWLDSGKDLGNHTFSHESPNTLGAVAYIADIGRGEAATRALLEAHHERMRWFRHPYLETGHPQGVKKEIDDWLAAHNYRIAPVTIDANDWLFAEPYDDAITRHDEKRRRSIKVEYLRYSEKMIGWARKSARALFGREIAYVMLLHATRLNADSIDDLAAILSRNHLRAVSLDKAMWDPAYRTPDRYVGPDGIDWLERWSQTLHKNLPWGDFSDPPADIKKHYDRIEKDR